MYYTIKYPNPEWQYIHTHEDSEHMGLGYLIKTGYQWQFIGNGQRSSQFLEASMLPEGTYMEILALRKVRAVFEYLGKEESRKS